MGIKLEEDAQLKIVLTIANGLLHSPGGFVPVIVKLQIFVNISFMGSLNDRRIAICHIEDFRDFNLQRNTQIYFS